MLGLIFSQCSATASKRSLGETLDDNVIVVKLKTRFIKDKGVASNKIHIRSWKGVVTLSGALSQQEQIDRAIELAEQQGGVSEVKSHLVVATFSPPKTKKSSPWPFSASNATRSKMKHKKETVIEEDLSETKEVAKKPDQNTAKNVGSEGLPEKQNEDYKEFEY